ncbi:MAG: CorA family divalent cation transporter [Pseudomonadota bacterium]
MRSKKAETGQGPTSVGAFFVELIGNLTRRIESVVNEIEETTDEIEEALSEETISIEEITKARMTTIKLKRYMSPQREALDDLIEQSIPWLDESALALISEYGNRNRRILETLDATRERLTALRDFVEAERANVLNRNSYLLSVIAAIFLPLGFLTGLFGVNVAGMPGTELTSAFWYLTLGSIVAGAALYTVFKLLKWL